MTSILKKIIIFGVVTGIFYCSSAVLLALRVRNQPPHYGDNMGLGILCISIPISLVAAGLSIVVVRAFLNRGRRDSDRNQQNTG